MTKVEMKHSLGRLEGLLHNACAAPLTPRQILEIEELRTQLEAGVDDVAAFKVRATLLCSDLRFLAVEARFRPSPTSGMLLQIHQLHRLLDGA